MKGLAKDFRDFAVKGNVVDMAVGVVIGGAFGKIVSSFLNDILMPPLGLVTGGMDFSDLSLTLKAAAAGGKPVTLNYGAFITVCIDFLIVAAAMFAVVRALMALKKTEPAASPPATEKECPECCLRVPIRARRCGHCAVVLS